MALGRECFDDSFDEVAFSSLCPMNQARVRCPCFFEVINFFSVSDEFFGAFSSSNIDNIEMNFSESFYFKMISRFNHTM